MLYLGQAWTFIAWCEFRNDFRQFRLDRILNLERVGEPFVPAAGQTLDDFFSRMKEA